MKHKIKTSGMFATTIAGRPDLGKTSLKLPAVTDRPLQPAAPESRSVAYALVRPDPNQPRKSFSEASLAELADSIKEQGIIQPLLVEFIPAAYELREPELAVKEWQVINKTSGGVIEHGPEKLCRDWLDRCHEKTGGGKDGYCIIAGERRWRAAGIVGLKELPALVYRGLSAQQRFTIQFIENNQREAVTALEEATAMQAQLASRRVDNPKFSPEDLAKELGMSRANCYERLALTRLHAPLREALLTGKVSASGASKIAKLPTPKMQAAVLGEVEQKLKYGHGYSVRDFDQLVDDYMKQLSEAPFDTALTYGNSKTGILDACTNCPKRSGNMLGEFPDLKSRQNVCTDPDCFAGKCKAFYLESAEAARMKGALVFTAKEFKAKRSEYVSAQEHVYGENRSGEFAKLAGKHAPEPVLLVTEHGVEKFYPRSEMFDALKLAGVKQSKRNLPETAEDKTKREAKEKELAGLKVSREALCVGLLPVLAKALVKLKDAVAWEITAGLLEEASSMRWMDDQYEDALVTGVKPVRDRLLGQLFSNNEASPVTHVGDWEKKILPFWKMAGVDLIVEEKKADTTQQAALPLAKKKPEQGKLLDVKQTTKTKFKMSAATKAKILASQRARWARVKASAKGTK